jgi:transcriptional regulator with XRE-family HTH domain
MDKYGKTIRELREKNNDTREDLAKKLKISESSLGKYERGERKIKPEMLEKIADVYGVPVTFFFDEEQQAKFSFTEGERDIILETNLTPEALKKKYNLYIDEIPATDEEIEEMIKYIKAYRLMKQMEGS